MSSREFDDAFCKFNAVAITCDFCGTEHRVREMEHDADAVGYGHLDGKVYVYQCGCGKVDRFEEWVWQHREEIAAYLRARADADNAEAERNAAIAESIPY